MDDHRPHRAETRLGGDDVTRRGARRVAVIGAGWSGAAAARTLHDHGVAVEVFEARAVVGGHARAERLRGVVYEPNGPHIFHTSKPRVADFVQRFGLTRRYAYRPLTQLHIDGQVRYFSWPLQLDELEALPQWDRVRQELADRPGVPCLADFESYCVSLLGETLYRLFVYHYTIKQWGLEPRRLSASMAARRIHLRANGDRRLFQDPWEFFGTEGVNPAIEASLAGIPVHVNTEIRLRDVADRLYRTFDHVVCTAPLDGFIGDVVALPWRGIRVRASHHDTEELDATVTRAYVINQPDPHVPFTRTVETKHATGQTIRGTVVCEEYPGHPAKHYPVQTVDNQHEQYNEALKDKIRGNSPIPVLFCGRLATYQYINQDEAIAQGMQVADELLGGR
jgi:UDP-galactopyranose mutase